MSDLKRCALFRIASGVERSQTTKLDWNVHAAGYLTPWKETEAIFPQEVHVMEFLCEIRGSRNSHYFLELRLPKMEGKTDSDQQSR